MQIEQQLERAQCQNPFQYLGVQETDTGLTLNVFIPSATKVNVVSLHDGRAIGAMQRKGESGYFSLNLSHHNEMLPYVLNVATDNGEFRVIDPYQFREKAYQAIHYVDHRPENIYQQLGAQLCDVDVGLPEAIKGVTFAVFAPNATAVSVVGDFNWWNGARHPMQKTDLGYWVLFIPEVEAGVKYKYQIKDSHGNELPHKADPVGFLAHQYPSHASEIFDQNAYEWHDQAWQNRKATDLYSQPMSIYEVHLGSWKKKSINSESVELYSYRELAEQLIPYIQDLGYTHIELLPISEHPFDGSWGYQPVGLFAPTSRFGNPDDFKYFVDQCHQNNIGVIIDWVPAHFPEDSHGLARFDGTHVYEYEDPRKGWHPDWKSCIYDYGKNEVRQFLVANALFWLDKYHIDGLRVDAVASMLYLDYSRSDGEWIPNVDGGNKNYEAISLLQWMNREVYDHFPKAFTVAEESTAFPKVSRPVYEGGLGFGFKWNMGWMHDSLHYISKDPAYRNHHHNEITFSMVYAFDENFVLPISHDEVVHGKGSLLRKMPGDEWQQMANLRCYSAFMFAHPGKKLNFMGNEIGQSDEWNHSSSVSWHLLKFDKHLGVQNLHRKLNALYRDYPALHELDCHHSGFEWIDHHNAEFSVVAFMRKAKNSSQKICVVSNFTPIPRQNYRIGVLDEGQYKMLLNTDEGQYWGSDFDSRSDVTSEPSEWHGKPHSIAINLPPLATLFYVFEDK